MSVSTVKGIKAALKEMAEAAKQLESDNGAEVINSLVYLEYAAPLALADLAKMDDDVAQVIEGLRGLIAAKQAELVGR